MSCKALHKDGNDESDDDEDDYKSSISSVRRYTFIQVASFLLLIIDKTPHHNSKKSRLFVDI